MQCLLANIADKYDIPVYSSDSIIIGSGCAAFNAADWLYDLNKRDIIIITEGLNMGTSRNTGSDKQTYYKLSLASDFTDSVFEMADTLFSGGNTNGDTALVEAVCSVKSFIKLVLLGVPFPVNIYGEYIGYKTDNDPKQRATSAGPLTSRFITECLENSVNKKGIKIFDKMQAIKFIVEKGRIYGVIALDLDKMENGNHGLTLFNCSNVIMATGGPAGVYYNVVYPESQTGMTGMALEAGAEAVNLQEWQYGLASTKFRWNVSGTYQQVLPKYVILEKSGSVREFLPEYFRNPIDALNMVFLKGYQWPFDYLKIFGSSVIDLIVHHEIFNKGNRVFMDFRSEPSGLENGFERLSSEAYNYLKRSGALISKPINRLEVMNKKALEPYQSHGINLHKEPLEISVCAQHQNGGIGVDMNWQSNIKGLYIAGEAAGTFGVYRPGGSALNSTQVGSMRAAEHIAYESKIKTIGFEDFLNIAKIYVKRILNEIEKIVCNSAVKPDFLKQRIAFQRLMSKHAAHIRSVEDIKRLKRSVLKAIPSIFSDIALKTINDIPHVFKNRDILITQAAVLSAMYKSATEIGSHGSALILDKNGEIISEKIPDLKFAKGKDGFNDKLVSTCLQTTGHIVKNENNNKQEDGAFEEKLHGKQNINFKSKFKPVRPIPQYDDWFENVWNDYLKKIEN